MGFARLLRHKSKPNKESLESAKEADSNLRNDEELYKNDLDGEKIAFIDAMIRPMD